MHLTTYSKHEGGEHEVHTRYFLDDLDEEDHMTTAPTSSLRPEWTRSLDDRPITRFRVDFAGDDLVYYPGLLGPYLR